MLSWGKHWLLSICQHSNWRSLLFIYVFLHFFLKMTMTILFCSCSCEANATDKLVWRFEWPQQIYFVSQQCSSFICLALPRFISLHVLLFYAQCIQQVCSVFVRLCRNTAAPTSWAAVQWRCLPTGKNRQRLSESVVRSTGGHERSHGQTVVPKANSFTGVFWWERDLSKPFKIQWRKSFMIFSNDSYWVDSHWDEMIGVFCCHLSFFFLFPFAAGQQVVEEILDAQRPGCPPEYFDIPIPADHPYHNRTTVKAMPFLRSRYDMRTGQSPNNPRQQVGCSILMLHARM